MDSNSAKQQISELGISLNASEVYIDLLGAGLSTVLQISKRTNISRATVYRALDELISAELVHLDGQNNALYKAENYHRLQELLSIQEKKISNMQSNLPDLFGYLLNVSGPSSGTSSIKYYEGQKGLEEVTRNTLAAKGMFRILELDNLNAFLDRDFAEFIRRESCRRRIMVHKITNRRKFDDFTNVEGYIGKWIETRHIEPRKLPINVEMSIYNDTVVIYDYRADIFCVEINNENLASMQRGMFDFIWKSSKKMIQHGPYGAASLK